MPVPDVPYARSVNVAPALQSVPDFQPVGRVAVALVPTLKFTVTAVPAVVIACCPHPVVAKVIKAAQIAIAWNLKRDFVTPEFRP